MGDYAARWLLIAGCALAGAAALAAPGIGVDAGSAWPRLELVLTPPFLAEVLGPLCGALSSRIGSQ